MPFEDFSLKGIIFLPFGGSIYLVFSLIGRGEHFHRSPRLEESIWK
jgi:hypothetical protein